MYVLQGRRAALEAKNAAPRAMIAKEVTVRRVMKIGRPGYKVRNGVIPLTYVKVWILSIYKEFFACFYLYFHFYLHIIYH